MRYTTEQQLNDRIEDLVDCYDSLKSSISLAISTINDEKDNVDRWFKATIARASDLKDFLVEHKDLKPEDLHDPIRILKHTLDDIKDLHDSMIRRGGLNG